MVIERFSESVINSGIFKFYIAVGFFAIVIFFILNVQFFTPMEILIGVIFVTVVLKGISNLMLSLVILLFNFDNKSKELDFEYQSNKIDKLLNELQVQNMKKSS